jgi:hypothetical protein
LYLASNGYARLELSYTELCRKVFGSFRKLPTEDELWNVVEEFVRNFLAVVYQVEGGSWWLQFATSEKFLPRYKTTRDERSPVPPLELMEKQREGYIAWKKAKSLPNQRFQKLAEISGEFSKVSAVVVVVVEVEGVGEGVGEEETSSKASAQRSNERNATDPPIGTLPCLGELKQWPYTAVDVAEWEEAYPIVDVPQQLREMRQWLISNSAKKKTFRGTRKFVTNWLGREQDRGCAPQHVPLSRSAQNVMNNQAALDRALERRGIVDPVVECANTIENLDVWEKDVDAMISKARTDGIFETSPATETEVRALLEMRRAHRQPKATNDHRPRLVINGHGGVQ